MKTNLLRLLGGLILVLSVLMTASGQVTNETQLITTSSRTSATAAGGSLAPSFSADGRSLMFLSRANNLVTNDNNRPWLDLFVHRLESGQTILASPVYGGTGGADADAESPAISADGNRVVYFSYASDAASPDQAKYPHKILTRDLQANSSLMVNVTNGTFYMSSSRLTPPVVSQNGRFVLFHHIAGGVNIIHLLDVTSNTYTAASFSTIDNRII